MTPIGKNFCDVPSNSSGAAPALFWRSRDASNVRQVNMHDQLADSAPSGATTSGSTGLLPRFRWARDGIVQATVSATNASRSHSESIYEPIGDFLISLEEPSSRAILESPKSFVRNWTASTNALRRFYIHKSAMEPANALQRELPTLEPVIRALEALRPGWAGPESVIPSDNAIATLRVLADAPLRGARRPDVEVDPETGEVTLSWLRADFKCSFTLHFRSDGEAVGVLVEYPVSTYSPWRFPASTIESLSRRLQDPRVWDLIAG